MTARCSTGSCGSSGPVPPGGMCPSGTGRGPRCTPASAGGLWMARSSACSARPRPSRRGRGHRLAGVGRLHRGPRPPARRRRPKRGPATPALGRSRGGLTSKIHLACDGRGRPLAFIVTGGNTNDCTQFTAVMEAIRVPRIGPGRPRVRPAHVLGDKGYSSRAIRTWLRRTRHHPHHPRTRRPAPQPAPTRQPRRTPAGLRQDSLQAPQRRRTLLQPPQAMARHRHPLRQDRRVLPSSRHPRITPDVGVTFEDNS